MYRHPGLISKMAATADVLSEGRLEFGIGIGSRANQDESRRFGIDFPAPRIRFKMLKESIEIIKRLWIEEKITYHGKHYQIKDAYCEPKPVQKPHPPIVIGGGGEKVTLRIVARYADKSNFSFTPKLEDVARKLNILKKNCQKIDRDFNSIEKTCTIGVIINSTRDKYLDDMKKRYLFEGSPGSFEEWLKKTESIFVTGTPPECMKRIKEYRDIGINHFIVRFGDTPSTNGLELFARQVIQKLSG
jgi:alkanesulfonate monooxygenase SsuD/methylene tetrahydromethanopterin reductase-like flavin-dependent oxidoreductase (luciferase family)